MKKLLKLSLVFFILAVVSFAALGAAGYWQSEKWTQLSAKIRTSQGYLETPEYKTFEVEAAAVEHLKIDISSHKVLFERSESDKITVTYYIMFEGQTVVSVDDGVLKIKPSYKFTILNIWFLDSDSGYYDIKVSIPQDYSFDQTEIHVSSGSVTTDQIGFKRLQRIEVSSGNVNIVLPNTVMNCNTVIDISSGNVFVDGLRITGKLDIDISSGTVTLNEPECEEMRIDVSSGKCSITSPVCDNYRVDLSSGTVHLLELPCESEQLKLSAHVSSGSVYVDAFTSHGKDVNIDPHHAQCTVKADISSGVLKVTTAGSESKT